MSDQALRALERALAAGEEAARLPLASAYLRQGRCGAAVGLLTPLPTVPPEGQGVLQAAWCQALAGLRPRGRSPGIRAWGTRLRWDGDGRTAIVSSELGGPVRHEVDRETLEVRVVREAPLQAEVPPERLAPLRAGAPRLAEGSWFGRADDRGWAVRHRGRELDLRALLRRLAPARAAGARWEARLSEELADGRLVLGDPLLVLDLRGDEPRAWAPDPGGRLDPPLRLAADGAALLGFVHGRPARVPLEPGPRRAPPPPGEGAGLWHPRADVAVTLPPWPRASELSTAEGQLLLRFPQGLRPLGFTPSGLSLLALAAFQPPDRGVLEVWGAGEGTAA